MDSTITFLPLFVRKLKGAFEDVKILIIKKKSEKLVYYIFTLSLVLLSVRGRLEHTQLKGGRSFPKTLSVTSKSVDLENGPRKVFLPSCLLNLWPQAKQIQFSFSADELTNIEMYHHFHLTSISDNGMKILKINCSNSVLWNTRIYSSLPDSSRRFLSVFVAHY